MADRRYPSDRGKSLKRTLQPTSESESESDSEPEIESDEDNNGDGDFEASDDPKTAMMIPTRNL